MGVPQARWFTGNKHLLETDDDWGYPHLKKIRTPHIQPSFPTRPGPGGFKAADRVRLQDAAVSSTKVQRSTNGGRKWQVSVDFYHFLFMVSDRKPDRISTIF